MVSISSMVTHCVKVSEYGVFSGPYFPVFGLTTEIYGLNLRIQSKYRKIRTRKNSLDIFHSVTRYIKLLRSAFLSKPRTIKKTKA